MASIAIGHFEQLACCAELCGDARVRRDVCDFVRAMLSLQPWYFQVPFHAAAWVAGVLCLCTHARSLPAFVRRIPPFSTLDAFIQAAVFLRVFDHPSLAVALPHRGV